MDTVISVRSRDMLEVKIFDGKKKKKKKISIFILICRDEQEGITKKKNPTNIQICSFSSPASFSSQMWCTDVLNDVL